MVIYPVDPIHILYGFHYNKLSFTGALICLFGHSHIFFNSCWINVFCDIVSDVVLSFESFDTT